MTMRNRIDIYGMAVTAERRMEFTDEDAVGNLIRAVAGLHIGR